jgi:hypothetical protein
MKKIAFMFLIGRSIQYDDVWVKFFKDADPAKYSIYVHAKKKSDTDLSPFFKKHLIPSVYTAWGDLILGEYQLFKYAYKNKNNTYFTLISDTTIPLKKFDDVYKEITSSKKTRLCYSEDMKYATSEAWRLSDMKKHIKRTEARKHSQWITLIRPHVDIFLKNRDKVDLWKMRRDWVIADETFIGTVLTVNGQKNIKNVCDTFVDWESAGEHSDSPYTYKKIEINHLIKLLAGKNLFARKFLKDTTVTRKGKKVCNLQDLLLEYI